MGTKVKIKSKGILPSTMPCGIHLATITDMKMARDSNHGLISTKDGEMAIDIHFTNKENKTAVQRFWLTDKARWMLDSLCKAIHVNIEGRQASKEEVVGKQLWIMMGAEYKFEGGDLIRLPNGTPEAFTRLVPKFFPVVTEGIKPVLQGDPDRNDGIPGGDFLLNADLDLEAWWTKGTAFLAALNGPKKIQPNKAAEMDESPFKSDAEIAEIQNYGTKGKESVDTSFGDWATAQIYGIERPGEEKINDEF